jgi:hypothetical protein
MKKDSSSHWHTVERKWLTRLVCGYDGNVAFQLPMAIPFKPLPRLASEESEGRWQRVRCVASNPSHPENYLAGALLDLLEGLHDKATPAPANDVPAPPKVTPEDVELQVGQTWLTRSGDTVKLLKLDHSDDVFPFEGDNDYWYTKMGRITRTSEMSLMEMDLVELVSDVEQAPKPDAAPNGSLVDRVAKEIANQYVGKGGPPWPYHFRYEARAAIREVAAAALRMATDKNLTWERVALWLEQEANHG